MSKEMNKFINNLIKYDLIGLIICSLILSITVSFKFAIVYLLGFIVSVVNFTIHSLVMERALTSRKNKWIIPINYFIRIAFVILLAAPFVTRLGNLLAFLLGYISHYCVMVFYWIKKGERM